MDPSTPNPPPPVDPAPSPRAFATGTGYALQIVGMTLFLSTCCCVWSTAGLWEHPVTSAASRPSYADPAPRDLSFRDILALPAKAGMMLTVMSVSVASLALAILGLGVQHEKTHAAAAAFFTAIALALLLLIAAIALWSGGASPLAKLWNAALFLIALVIAGFTWTAWRQLVRFPPPPQDNTLPPDFDFNSIKRH